MIRYIAISILSMQILLAYTHDDIKDDYKNGNYKDACIKSAKFYKYGEKNEEILSIVGDACAKVDFINPLGYIVRGLVSTPTYRENGSYFATLLLQKKLIYQFMSDDIDLKNLRLPRSNHVLSIVFENLVKKNYEVLSKKKYKIKLDDTEYIIWIDDKKLRNVHVDVYKNGEVVKRHWYL